MGIATFPNTVSPIKSIQRGSAVSAGNITITSVVVAKTTVNSFSTGSAGTVAATGTVNAANGSTSGSSTSGSSSTWNHGFNYQTISGGAGTTHIPASWYSTYNLNQFQGGRYGQTYYYQYQYFEVPRSIITANINGQNINGLNVGLNATSLTGGTTSLTSAVYGAYLQDSTTLVVTGPCRYEVVEYF